MPQKYTWKDRAEVTALRTLLGWPIGRMAEQLGVAPSILDAFEEGTSDHADAVMRKRAGFLPEAISFLQQVALDQVTRGTTGMPTMRGKAALLQPLEVPRYEYRVFGRAGREPK